MRHRQDIETGQKSFRSLGKFHYKLEILAENRVWKPVEPGDRTFGIKSEYSRVG